MRKIIFRSFLAFSLFHIVGANAQLTVKGTNAFVYVGDELLYVDKGVALDEGKLYLRRGGQLLQANKTTALNTATGTGALSTYVMSKATNQFNYTHYGLPVFTSGQNGLEISTASLGGASSVTGFNPYTPGNRSLDGLASATGGVRLNADFITWYGGSSSNAYNQWKYPVKSTVPADKIVPKGYGLYFKGTGGSDTTDPGEGTANKASSGAAQRIEFRGVPNDGNISIAVAPNTLYNLGNPYPSSFNINQFMDDNSAAIEGIYYYVEKNVNTHTITFYDYGYAKYTRTANGGVLTMPAQFYKSDNEGVGTANGPADPSPVTHDFNTPFIGIGTGFWVKTSGTATELKFNNDQRAYTDDIQNLTSYVARKANATGSSDYGYFPEIINTAGIDYTKMSKEPTPTISLVASANNVNQSIALLFRADANDEYIHLSDLKSDSDKEELKVYIDGFNDKFRLKNTPFESSKRIPITIESKNEQVVKFAIDNLINYNLSNNIYIYDDQTGVYTDLLKGDSNINIPAGLNKGRYYITFAKGNENLSTDNNVNNAFIVLQNNREKVLTISNPESLNVKSTDVFDIQGKLVFSKSNLGTEPEYRFSTSSFANGIYVVKINTANGKSVSKKVIVKN